MNLTPLILDGNLVRDAVLDTLKIDVAHLKQEVGKVPGLAVILVGDNPASRVYVNSKKKACEKVGMMSFEHLLSEDTSESKLIDLIIGLNRDDFVHGILLQLPLPKGLDSDKLLNLIDPKKDVDGFHPFNVGCLLQGVPTFQSCTPYGVCQILDYYNIETKGKHVVIVGRSNIVGKPLAAMLIQKGRDATVTICHSCSTDMPSFTKQADILVAAVGVAELITADMVKEGAVVIDVGINRVEDPLSEKGYRLVGDVLYNQVSQKVSAITPVPGGVGPMTIAMLLKNTLAAFCKFQGI